MNARAAIAEIQAAARDCDPSDEFDLLIFAGDVLRIIASVDDAASYAAKAGMCARPNVAYIVPTAVVNSILEGAAHDSIEGE